MLQKIKNLMSKEETIDQVEEQDAKKAKSKKKSTRKTKWEKKAIELEQELEEQKEKYLRLFAEFDNFKKRTMKEKLDSMKTAAQSTLREILPVLDDFDRAKTSAESDDSEEVFTEGVRLVYNKIYSVLANQGLKPMESDAQVFDPELHEAVTNTPAPTEDLKGKVVHTVEKGYYLNDKIIRHAKVVVGN